MKGKVLEFSIGENRGVISGDDGNRYTFEGKEWRSQAHPVTGSRVDFESEGKVATGVYLDAPVRVGGAGAINTAAIDPSLDGRYSGFYCSEDDKIIFGLCGGLAHKFGVPTGAVRLVVFLSMFAFVGFGYLIGLFLPKLPTRNVARLA